MKDKEFDISSLLKSKDFDSLNTIEQEFVLTELGSREKYTELQDFIIAQSNAPDVLPPNAIRKNVMDSFDSFHSKEKRRIGLWKPERKWYQHPVTIALVAASILVAVFLILPIGENLNQVKIAENKPAKKEAPKTSTEKPEAPKTLESLDKQKENQTSEDQGTSKQEIQIAQPGVEQSEALNDNNNANNYGSSAPQYIEPIAAAPASNDLLSMADEAPQIEEIQTEDEISTISNDSNMNMKPDNMILAETITLNKKSTRSQSDAMLEKEDSDVAMTLGNSITPNKMNTDIFLIAHPLPDHYVAY